MYYVILFPAPALEKDSDLPLERGAPSRGHSLIFDQRSRGEGGERRWDISMKLNCLNGNET